MMHTVGTPWLWGGFVAFVLAMLVLDLGVFNRKDHVITTKEALRWTAFWIALALLFNGLIWWKFGTRPAIEFLTGYLIEKSLSVDNLFVFVIIFGTFAIPAAYQHRVLFWGIVTALVLRAVMIVGGTALLSRFHWLIYVFGAFLLVTGVRLFFHKEEEHHPERSWAFRTLRRVIPSTHRIEGHAFFLRDAGRIVATPLLLALALIEISDVVFALDSIPAIFGVTLDPFIVFTSNIFAILGLRSLYFAVAQLLNRFEYLSAGLSAVLVFIGGKMLVSRWIHVHPLVSLAVVVAILGGAMIFSFVKTRRAETAAPVERPSP
ncbi:TerC family protein [Anaeromyxobacter sp. Fw109-5]|uniref:TerC family protein n=1 Tax=Anaeromyxobacter sp. (strain Fw109-5) TaxID=404589 RepID=UPI0000ED81FA|nr:TerC family protein [Anaeromyxobacter sp. Fw109-5]ABS25996.1 Integral membrane protein TerC [Anaeromyxobacter sp. Fw109-5]